MKNWILLTAAVLTQGAPALGRQGQDRMLVVADGAVGAGEPAFPAVTASAPAAQPPAAQASQARPPARPADAERKARYQEQLRRLRQKFRKVNGFDQGQKNRAATSSRRRRQAMSPAMNLNSTVSGRMP